MNDLNKQLTDALLARLDFGKDVQELVDYVQELFDLSDEIEGISEFAREAINQVLDIFSGRPIEPINEAVQNMRDWFAKVPSDFTKFLTDLSNLDATKLINMIADARIPGLASSKITSGILNVLRVPNLSASKIVDGIFDVLRVPTLDASKITSGTFAQSFIKDLTTDLGAKLTALSQLDAGKLINMIADARIPGLDAGKITGGLLDILRVPDLDAAKVTTGTFAQSFIAGLTNDLAARLTAVSNLDATKLINMIATARIPGLDAGKITGGIFNVLRVPDLTAAKITGGILDILRVPDLDAAKITSGTFAQSFIKDLTTDLSAKLTALSELDAGKLINMIATARIPGLDVSKIVSGVFGEGLIPTLAASKIGSGILDILRVPDLAASKIGSGILDILRVPDLDTGKITSGTFAQSIISGLTTDLAARLTALSNLDAAKLINTIADARIPSLAAGKITSGTFLDALIPTLAATKIGSGILDLLRVPDLPASKTTSGILSVLRVPDLDAAKIASGTLGAVRIPSLDASKITSGEFGDALIPTLAQSKITGLATALAEKLTALSNLDATKLINSILPARIPGLDVTKIVSGVFGDGFIPTLAATKIGSGILDILRVPNLDTSKITSGQLPAGRLADLDASKIISGTLSDLRIPNLDFAKIASGFLDMNRVAGNAITVGKLKVTDFTNIAVGSNFEDSRLVPWTLSAPWTIDNTVAHTGKASLRCDGTKTGTATLQTDAYVQEGESYHFEFWVKRDEAWDGTSSNSKLRIGDQINTHLYSLGFQRANMSLADHWYKREYDLVIPEGVTKLNATLNNDATAGNVWIDDIVIRRMTNVETVVDGAISNLKLGNDISASKIVNGILDILRVPALDASKITSGAFAQSFISGLTADLAARLTALSDLDSTKLINMIADVRIPSLDVSKIVSGVFGEGFIPALAASKIGSGILDLLRVPDLPASKTTSGILSVLRVPDLDAAKIASGTLGAVRIPSLDASKIGSGTFLEGLIPTLTQAKITGLAADLAAKLSAASSLDATKLINMIADARIPGLAATKITSGLLDILRVPALDASKITTGTFAQSFIANLATDLGAKLTALSNLDAGKLINTIADARIPSLSAGKITTGTFLDALIPTLAATKIGSGILDILRVPDLDAAKVTSGQLPAARVGNLDAGKITGGILDVLRVPSLDASKIASGFLNAGRFGASTISLAKLVTSDTSSVIEDGDFALGGVGFSNPNGVVVADITDSPLGGSAKVLQVATTGSLVDRNFHPVSTAPGEVWYAECYVRKTTDGVVGSLGLQATVSLDGLSKNYPTFSAGGTSMTDLAQGEWRKLSGLLTVPAGRNRLEVRCSVRDSVPAGEVIQFAYVKMRKATQLEMIADGAVSNLKLGNDISASKLVNGILDVLRVPNLDASKIASGTFAQSFIAGLTTDLAAKLTALSDLDSTKLVNLIADARIPLLSASKIGSGILDILRVPDLDTSKVTSGTFAQSFVANLATDLGAKLTALSNLDAGKLINTVAEARIPGLDVSKIISGVFGDGFIPTLAATKIGSGILDALRVPNLDSAKITTGVFTQARVTGLVTDLAAKLTSVSNLDAGKLINAIADARIPGLSASKITSGLFDLLRVPDLPATKLTSGTIDLARVPDLDASKITTGAIDSLRIPELDASKIATGTLPQSRIADLAENFQNTWDFVWQGAGNKINEGTGKSIADVRDSLAALFGNAATALSRADAAAGNIQSIQDVVFIRSGRPLWEGIDPTGEASFPWDTLTDGVAAELNTTSSTARIGFIRLGHAGVRSQVSFVGKRVTSGDVSIDLYRMNSDGSMPTAIWSSGNIDSSFQSSPQQVQIDIQDTLFDVGDVIAVQLRVNSGSYNILGKRIYKPVPSVLFPFRPMAIGAVRSSPSAGGLTQAQVDSTYSAETPYFQIGAYDENIGLPRRFLDGFNRGDTSVMNLGANWMVQSRDQNGNNTKVGWRLVNNKAVISGTSQVLFVSTLATFTIPMSTDDIVIEFDAYSAHADRPGGVVMHVDSAGNNFCAFMIKNGGVSFRSFDGVGFNTDIERAATSTSGNNVHWKVTFSSDTKTYRAYKNRSTSAILEWQDSSGIVARQENKRYGGMIGSHSGLFIPTWSAELDNFDIYDASYAA